MSYIAAMNKKLAVSALVFAACGQKSGPGKVATEPTAVASQKPVPVAVIPPLVVAAVAMDNATISKTVLASLQWPRLTAKPMNKNSLCAAAGPMVGPGFVEGSHPDHVGEQFHLHVQDGATQYANGEAMPDGAVIVKRSFTRDGATTAFFMMSKRAKQNPKGGDWLYATTKPDGTVIRSGALTDCAACHDKKAKSDYLFRSY
jgi:hypothetical protein